MGQKETFHGWGSGCCQCMPDTAWLDGRDRFAFYDKHGDCTVLLSWSKWANEADGRAETRGDDYGSCFVHLRAGFCHQCWYEALDVDF